jgi:hypothetical protein
MRARLRYHKRLCLVAVIAPLSVLLAIASVTPASAYRPFDGTDAAVADPGELEIELQPAGALWQQAQKTLVAPATVFNFGLSQGWEAVLEGRMETPLSPAGPTSLTASAVSLKHVVIPGSLQDKAGPSVATEFGLLLPDSNGQSGFGASVAGIVSQRWEWGTVHFNAATALTRDQHGDLFLSTILEGPAKWTVRPVAEIYYENAFGQAETISALVGLIWQVRDTLSFDVGVRQALTNGRPVSELRAGLTVGFPELFRSLGANDRTRRDAAKQ